MSEVTNPLAWVAMAEEDWILARSALRRKLPLTYGASFHAQQCAEKYLKAALVSRKRDFPKLHDILALSRLCEQAGMTLGMDEDRLDELSTYAVTTRYPGSGPTPE